MSEFRFDGSIAEVDFQGIGEKSNTSFMGVFRFKCVISPIDYLKTDRLYRELLGSINPHLASKDAQNFAFALSQLKFRIVESPDFFKNKEIDGGHLDKNILIDLINLAVDAEQEFKKLQNEKVKKLQDMLTARIKNKEIVKDEESEEPIEDKEIPEIDLGE